MILRQPPLDVKKVFDSYEGELRLVEESLRRLFESNVHLIPLIGRYLVESGGKRMRPLFLLVSARLAGYSGENHIPLAGVIESIHTASLLHDDVVDGADLRRGRATANSVWGNHVVILVGDFLYSSALKRSVSFGDVKIVEAVSRAVNAMTEGELLQLAKSGDVTTTEEEYLKIISAKTGVLISAACRIGGLLAGARAEKTEALARFGYKAGITFQMADDLLDYGAGANGFGKKLGKDLDEGKVTLPLIYLIEAATADEREEITRIVDSGFSKEGLAGDGLKRVLDLFYRYDVLDRALGRAQGLLGEAKAELDVFPDSQEKRELLALADYALGREH
jgi:octaprenyl-diphosphate synthase